MSLEEQSKMIDEFDEWFDSKFCPLGDSVDSNRFRFKMYLAYRAGAEEFERHDSWFISMLRKWL